MKISFDEKEIAKQINCYKIECNAKPDLMAKTLNNDKTMVVVVDMINGFCKKGNLSSPRSEACIAPIKQFLNKVPLSKKVFVRDEHSDSSIEFKTFPVHCTDKTESAWVKELSGFDAIDLAKNSTNAFFVLKNRIGDLAAFNNIVVIGVCTDICVMQLALTLRAYFNELNASTNVLVFTDCVDTYDSPLHDANLSNLFAIKFLEQAGVQIFKNIL